jgi:hypothetical protein
VTYLLWSSSFAYEIAALIPATVDAIQTQVEHRPRSVLGPTGALALEAQADDVFAGALHHARAGRQAQRPKLGVTNPMLMGLEVIGASAQGVVLVILARGNQLPQMLRHPLLSGTPRPRSSIVLPAPRSPACPPRAPPSPLSTDARSGDTNPGAAPPGETDTPPAPTPTGCHLPAPPRRARCSLPAPAPPATGSLQTVPPTSNRHSS